MRLFNGRQFEDETASVTRRLEHALSRWPLDIKVNKIVSPYDLLPFLFREAFPGVAPAQLITLGVFSRSFTAATLMIDNLVDADSGGTRKDVLRMVALQMESCHALFSLFPPQATFWDRYQRYVAEFMGAMSEEQDFVTRSRPLSEYTQEVAFRIAAGKTGLTRIMVAALAELANDESSLPDLIQAASTWGVAEQMFDDLQDWKKDVANGIPSLLVARATNALSGRTGEALSPTAIGRLGREIYYGGHATYVLDVALEHLARTRSHEAKYHGIAFFQIVDLARRQCEALRRDITELVRSKKQRAGEKLDVDLHIPEATDPWLELAWSSLRFLLKQWRLGFGEARDLAVFPEMEDGFGPAEKCFAGDVFQRAIIADVLCDADVVLGGSLRPVIASEVEYLLSRRQTEGIGAWCYYFDLPELPPDVDDLGQVMQVLLRSDRRSEIARHCEPPVSVLLRDNTLPEGGFQTWIVPALDRSPREERQAYFVKRSWGAGADSAAMANLLYALWHHDPVRFEEPIRRGTSFVIAHQQAKGCWQSGWYFDNYYATFACVRLLMTTRAGSDAVAHVARHLREAQRPDGGWGTLCDGESDALNTALALLSLALTQADAGEPGDSQRAEAARAFLMRTRLDDLSWAAQKFIHVPGGRYVYESRTLTTAYVLKAMLAWRGVTTTGAGRAATPREAP